jgi:hypothetical protein
VEEDWVHAGRGLAENCKWNGAEGAGKKSHNQALRQENLV